MKKIVIGIVMAIAMIGCTPNKNDVAFTTTDGNSYTLRTIDGCEYLIRSAGYGGYMAHKGDCKNPIHPYNVVIEPVVVKPRTIEDVIAENDSLSEIIRNYPEK